MKDANGAVLDFEAEVYSDYSNPIITATKTNTTCGSCTDGAIDLDIQYGAPNFNVSWSNGQTGVNLSNVAAGTYTATITDNCGNVFTETFDVSGVGISSKATIEANIYPNPASDLLFIETKSPIKTIKVRAINGRTVLNQVGNGSKATISLKNLAKGIYLVEVTSDLGRHVAKQIVE